MGWIVRAPELPITRDGESVILHRGDAVPEAEFWEARDKLVRTKHIYFLAEPPAKVSKEKEETNVTEPKRSRGRPRKVDVSMSIDKTDEEKKEE